MVGDLGCLLFHIEYNQTLMESWWWPLNTGDYGMAQPILGFRFRNNFLLNSAQLADLNLLFTGSGHVWEIIFKVKNSCIYFFLLKVHCGNQKPLGVGFNLGHRLTSFTCWWSIWDYNETLTNVCKNFHIEIIQTFGIVKPC